MLRTSANFIHLSVTAAAAAGGNYAKISMKPLHNIFPSQFFPSPSKCGM